jgi:hypothetical protein
MYGKAALQALTWLFNTSHVWKSRVTGTDAAFRYKSCMEKPR